MTYHVSDEDALRNAARLMKDGRVGAVKIEGGAEVAQILAKLVRAGIPVCGHLGFTPQSTHAKGGPRMQAREAEAALALLEDAKALEAAGAFAIVLELVPATVAKVISERLSIPTIGIGAGPHCDGEVQVFHDLLGLYTDFQPRHTKRYLNGSHDIVMAMREFVRDVVARTFPGREQTSDLKDDQAARFRALLENS
jgi:3-methyl-2-oxobutanoate hydroxymethyltransferase